MDPRLLEQFFYQYLPSFKVIIEDLWKHDKEQLKEFLNDCTHTGIYDSWMKPYFDSMITHVNRNHHEYPNPWNHL